MEKEQIIQSITVGENLQRTYSVGDEVSGQVVIEISAVEGIGEVPTYALFAEDQFPLLAIEGMPVIVEYTYIAVDGPEQ